MDELEIAIEAISQAVDRLQKEAISYYDARDNRRGNLRYDTANRFMVVLSNLKEDNHHLRKSLTF